MGSFGFHVIPVGLRLAHVSELVSNFLTLGKSIALLFGANFLSRPTYPSDPFRYLIVLFGFAALAATLFAAIRLSLRRSDPTVWAYACFWATGAVFISSAYWVSNLPVFHDFEAGLNYLLTLAPAAGVGAALVASGSSRGRFIASLAIAAVGVVNLFALAHGRAQTFFPRRYGPQLIRLLEQKGLTRGYGPYADAQNLTWKSGMRVLVSPVRICGRNGRACPFRFFTIDSWYTERPERSFLIVDRAEGSSTIPPALYGRPSQVFRVAPGIAVYVYPYDLARHMRN
jgi:hypothetical protein